MTPRDFVVWLNGVMEAVGDRVPGRFEWELVCTKLQTVSGAEGPYIRPGWMHPDGFPDWLRGFIAGVEELPTLWQWRKLREVNTKHLANMARDKILASNKAEEELTALKTPVNLARELEKYKMDMELAKKRLMYADLVGGSSGY